MRIGRECGLSEVQLNELFYALLLKDCGCSGNASKMFHAFAADDLKAKRDGKLIDWTRLSWEGFQYALSHTALGKPFIQRVKTLIRLAANQTVHARDVTKIRCERGATLARLMKLPEATATAILDLDEHWDGSGNPNHLRGRKIYFYSRIMLLAQTLDNFAAAHSKNTALDVIWRRSGKWFDPGVVKAALSLAKRGELWNGIDALDVSNLALTLDHQAARLKLGDETLDSICLAFGQIIDAKSPFTFNHSNGVANAAVAIAQKLNLPPDRVLLVRHAALLHDLGKLAVSNTILEKPGKLDDDEWKIMKRHPEDTYLILRAIPHFGELSEIAASHHEKLNGQGYFRNLNAEQLSLEARIIAVADIFDALSAKRPYRDAIPLDKVLSIMRKDAPLAIDADCFCALEQSGIASDQTFRDLHTLNQSLKLYQ